MAILNVLVNERVGRIVVTMSGGDIQYVSATHPQFKTILELSKTRTNDDALLDLIEGRIVAEDMPAQWVTYHDDFPHVLISGENIRIKIDNESDGMTTPRRIADHLIFLSALKNDELTSRYIKIVTSIMRNPASEIRQQLFNLLTHNLLPYNDDGCVCISTSSNSSILKNLMPPSHASHHACTSVDPVNVTKLYRKNQMKITYRS